MDQVRFLLHGGYEDNKLVDGARSPLVLSLRLALANKSSERVASEFLDTLGPAELLSAPLTNTASTDLAGEGTTVYSPLMSAAIHLLIKFGTTEQLRRFMASPPPHEFPTGLVRTEDGECWTPLQGHNYISHNYVGHR